jgi:hypothetical protein
MSHPFILDSGGREKENVKGRQEFEYRSTNIETNSNFKKAKFETMAGRIKVSVIGEFGFGYCFGFRVSNFEFDQSLYLNGNRRSVL